MRKRALLLGVIISLLTFSFVSCSKTDKPEEGGKVKIRISSWGADDERAVFEAVLDDFRAANPDIEVEFLHIPDQYSMKMNTMIAGGTAPDVIFTSDGDFPRWVQMGAFKDITAEVQASEMINTDDMWETGLKRYMYDGKKTGAGSHYALPKDIGPTVLYYNKELFDKYDVEYPSSEKPMSWEVAMNKWSKLTVDEDGDGEVDYWGAGPIWWEGFVFSNGGAVLNDNRTEFVLGEDEGAEAMQLIYDLSNKYKIVPDNRALSSMNDGQMFEAGVLASITGGRWMVPTYRKLGFDWDVAPIPTSDGEWRPNGWSGSVGLGVYAGSDYPDAAFKLVEWFAGIPGQTKMTELGFQIPNFKSMSDDEVYTQPGQKPEHPEVFTLSAEYQEPGLWTYLPNSMWFDVLNQNLGEFWTGEQSAKEFFSELKPLVEEALEEGNPNLF